MWATIIFAERIKTTLKLKPSEYLARNVRVTPHNIVEPVREFLEVMVRTLQAAKRSATS
jgi:hypothetical protein